MHVEFTFHGTVSDAAGWDRLDREPDLPADATVGDALAAVLRAVPDAEPLVPSTKGQPRANVALRRNDAAVRSGEWLKALPTEGDRSDVEPSVEGAC